MSETQRQEEPVDDGLGAVDEDDFCRITNHLRWISRPEIHNGDIVTVKVLQQLWNHFNDPEGLGDGVWKDIPSVSA